jgi:putative chitinase
MPTITIDLLKKICPKTKVTVLEKFVAPLNEVSEHYEINTPQRMAAFLAQLAHESGGFNAIKENLNYSAKGLMTTFKKYFPNEALAKEYERQPVKIANKVYANRMGNGNEASGDGSKFCGRGLIQLTGKHNYTRLSADLEMSIDECIKYLETPEGAVASAGWFWDQNNLNPICDRGDIKLLTRRINGGFIGLADRIHHYEIALKVLGE